MYSVLVKEDFPLTRDELAKHLRSLGVDTRPFFIPMHSLPMYARGERLPVAERLSQQGLNLPSSTTLTTDQIERVAAAIRSALR